MRKGELSHLAVPGSDIAVRVSPRASRNEVKHDDDGLRMLVTAPPEGGKANQVVRKLLARALGVPKSSLTLVRGASARSKVFRIAG